eukprot:SAG22_NODE_10342_length_540_cov_0.900227_1_plen_31_part_10
MDAVSRAAVTTPEWAAMIGAAGADAGGSWDE